MVTSNLVKFAFLILLVGCRTANVCRADGLEPLPYNHPGLVVDLGVGLWAWPIPCDADDDGDFDLIVSCPDKPSNGVWLFENTTGVTSTHKMPVFSPAKQLSKTVHYVMPSYVDGRMRVLSPGVEYVEFTKTGIDQRIKLPIEAQFHKPQGVQTKGPRLRHNQWRYVDFDGDGRLDLVVAVEDWSDYGWDDAWDENGKWVNGSLHGWIYFIRNRGTNEQPEYEIPQHVKAGGEQLEVYGCPSPNFADFDGDQDLDLICGEFVDGFTYFENIGTRTKPLYANGLKLKEADGDRLAMDLQMIVPVAFDWDLDGDADLIVGDEDGRVALVENSGQLREEDGRRLPVFHSPVYFQQLADKLKCGALATPVGFDWDGDGDTDILCGNTAGYIELMENLSGPKVASPKWHRPLRLQVEGKPFRIQAGSNGSIQGPAEAKWGYTTFSIADWDGDELPDIVFNSILGKVCWLKNLGPRERPMLAAPLAIEVEWSGEQPRLNWGWMKPHGKELLTQWRTTPVVYDFTGDGLVDLAMLDHEGYLVLFERTNTREGMRLSHPRRAFVGRDGEPLRWTSGVAGKSGRRKFSVTDWDGDGKFDFLLNSANADWWRQVESPGSVWVFENTGPLAAKNIEGHDVSPSTVDFDGDGVVDLIGGAEDGRIYYQANPRTSAK